MALRGLIKTPLFYFLLLLILYRHAGEYLIIQISSKLFVSNRSRVTSVTEARMAKIRLSVSTASWRYLFFASLEKG